MQETFKQLSLDERDAVADILDHPGWRAFVRLVDGLAEDAEQKVIRLNVNDGVEKVVQQKLRAEGARQLAKDVSLFPQYVRKLNKKG